MKVVKLTSRRTLIKRSSYLIDWQNKFSDTAVTVAPGQTVNYLWMQGFGNKQPRHVKIILRHGSTVKLYGLTVGSASDKLQADIEICHEAPRATSRVDLKAVLAGEAQAKLNGVIRITSEGNLSDARLEERVLLLSDAATAQAIPNLEIEACDVKASHAATVSHINSDELFYLQTRSLTPAEAQRLIIQGFLSSVLSAWPATAVNAKLKLALSQALKDLAV